MKIRAFFAAILLLTSVSSLAAGPLLTAENSIRLGMAALLGVSSIGAGIWQLASYQNCNNGYVGHHQEYCQQNDTDYLCTQSPSQNQSTPMCIKPLKEGEWTCQQTLQTVFGTAVAIAGAYASMIPEAFRCGRGAQTGNTLLLSSNLLQLQCAYGYYALMSSDGWSALLNGVSVAVQAVALVVVSRRPRAEIRDPFGLGFSRR